VARTVDRDHRDRLLDAVARDLVARGLGGASLERLASAAGTSARMLVHHFESRDRLLGAALDLARARELARARSAFPATPDFLVHLRNGWAWFSEPETQRYFRLFTEVAADERLTGRSSARATQAGAWLEVLGDGFRSAGYPESTAPALATMVAAELRGLFLDLDATGDHHRVEQAYGTFIDLITHDSG
jgi:AcrR family transcriptional regulator